MLLHRGTLPGSARAACFRSHKCLAAPRLQPVASRGLKVRCAVPAEPVTLSGEGSPQLALNVAKEATAKGLVHRYLVTVRQNARQGSANTKTRAEVRGGGKKPYKQKGTGNARQGSKSSPLLRGGGVVFGPKPKDYSIKMNRKEKKLAMATALQSAAPSMTVVKPMKEAVTQPKTKLLKQALEAAGVGKDEHVLIVLNELTEAILLAARNVQQITLNAADRLNVYDVLRADKIVVEDASLQYIQEYYGAQKA